MTRSEKLHRARIALQFVSQAIDALEAEMHETIYDYDLLQAWIELDTIRAAEREKSLDVRTIKLTAKTVVPPTEAEGFSRFGDLA